LNYSFYSSRRFVGHVAQVGCLRSPGNVMAGITRPRR
jgi:hypothetical protein